MLDGTAGVTTRRRWRRWSTEQKLRIVAESDAPGSGVSIVAARYDVRANLVSTWRQQVRDGLLGPASSPGFVPVRVATAAEASRPPPNGASGVDATGIEIALPDGIRLHINHAAQLPLLRGVLSALRG